MQVKRTRRKRSEDNRRRIARGAQTLFARSGFDGVSVDEIVAAVRINKRMVYHYFGSKEKLYREVLLDAYASLEKLELEIFAAADDPETIFRTVVASYFRFLSENPNFVRLLLWENLNYGRAIRKQAHLLSKDPALTRLATVIGDGIKAGRFRRHVNIPHLLIQVIGLCFIYHSNRYTLSHALEMDLGSAKELETGMHRALDLLLNGYRVADATADLCLATRERSAARWLLEPRAATASAARSAAGRLRFKHHRVGERADPFDLNLHAVVGAQPAG